MGLAKGQGARVTDEATQRPDSPRRPARRSRDGARQPRTGADVRADMRDRLIESRLTPNAISLTGFLLNLVAAALIVNHYYFLGGVAFIVGSLMDMFDGRYSRMSGKGTPFGAFLDSTLDRTEEGVVLAAVAWVFAERGDEVAVAATVLSVVGSYMVSYTRARAEALGVECKVGFATRAVRVVILSAGLVLAKGAGLADVELLEPAIYVMAALTIFTTFQRVWHVRKQLIRADAV
jgi:CDP-diacylglycerol--glycerol-3-phosphate 3-phosphatidyltransferase